MQKVNPWRSKKYLAWVKSQYCCETMQQADDAHHVIGVLGGGMGTKPHDLFTMPLARNIHTELHSYGVEQWENMHSTNQAEQVLRTLNNAINNGVIEIKFTESK